MAKHRRDYRLEHRLAVAHRSSRQIATFAGELLERIEVLKRDVAARDLLIEQLKEQLREAEAIAARAARF